MEVVDADSFTVTPWIDHGHLQADDWGSDHLKQTIPLGSTFGRADLSFSVFFFFPLSLLPSFDVVIIVFFFEGALILFWSISFIGRLFAEALNLSPLHRRRFEISSVKFKRVLACFEMVLFLLLFFSTVVDLSCVFSYRGDGRNAKR
ncbi:hypothetical protein AAFF_G00137580 [Aldrovandia affinis]|uniref:Transmembrane protein n=1 Tax=Aldrovandia affinis TaxID=143900 RepID=A0AAD7X3M2_9TELE|nr:hypothetical protein AAFF_G00137580 [Aldrovandia affinis]